MSNNTPIDVLEPYVKEAITKFPIPVLISGAEVFEETGRLFKNNRGGYLFMYLSDTYSVNKLVFARVFKSLSHNLKIVEDDFLDFSISFSFEKVKDFKIFIQAHY